MYQHINRRPNLAPLAIIGTLLILIVISLNNRSQKTYAPLSAYFDVAQAPVPVSQITPLPAAQAEVIEQSPVDWRTEQVELILEMENYREQLPELGAELQTALNYVQERTAIRLLEPVRVIITADANCGFHGLTYSDIRVIYVYSCPSVPIQRIVNLSAHEFVHQLAHDRYGAAHLQADLILSEGLATWGAGSYWLGGSPSFQTFIQSYLQNNEALPLATHYRDVSGISGMNTLYYEWASFVEFLLATSSREQFDQLYLSGGGQLPGAAQYQTLYGLPLSELELRWQAWYRN